MIQTEYITINGTEYKRTYSDSNFYIRQVATGAEYEEAVDVLSSTNTYTETDREIEEQEEEPTNTLQQ